MSNWTSAERPSWESWPLFAAASGERTRSTCGSAETVRTASATVALKRGSRCVAERDWTSTLSPALSGKPARFRICSAVLVPPAAVSACFSIFVPATVPSAIAAMQKASQASTAVLRCSALQRPARPAILTLISAS